MSDEPWADWLLALANWLEDHGHRYVCIARHLGRLKTLAVWAVERGQGPEAIADLEVQRTYVAEFAAEFHLLHGREPGRGAVSQVRAAMDKLVTFARATGRLPQPPAPPVSPLLERYLEFARVHRGISVSSQKAHRKFLTELAVFADQHGANGLAGLELVLIDDFVAEYSRTRSRTTVGAGLGALRSFLRWLFLVGEEAEDRSGWIVGPRLYQSMRLPRHLTDEQLEEALNGVDRSTPGGRQEWAVLALVATLGLRIGEVARLQLADINLESAQLRVARPKTGAETLVPLCPELVEALRDYLAVRSETSHQALFVTWRAPIRPYANGASLGRVVSKHLARLPGLSSYGPHSLRHTLARRLLQGGTSVAVIRRVLGHGQSDSTGRYLRIATDELAEVAASYAELL